MKGLFIPDITAEMFRSGCLESIEALMANGEIYDIDYEPEQRWIPCGKCIHADGKHRWCKILDRSINEDYFCYWAEPW